MKTTHTISHSEYLQLTGLLVLVKRHVTALKDLEAAMLEITQEKDHEGKVFEVWGGGHTGDAIYGDCTAEDLMDKIGIKVEDKT